MTATTVAWSLLPFIHLSLTPDSRRERIRKPQPSRHRRRRDLLVVTATTVAWSLPQFARSFISAYPLLKQSQAPSVPVVLRLPPPSPAPQHRRFVFAGLSLRRRWSSLRQHPAAQDEVIVRVSGPLDSHPVSRVIQTFQEAQINVIEKLAAANDTIFHTFFNDHRAIRNLLPRKLDLPETFNEYTLGPAVQRYRDV
ncbi:hypothetical protein Ahy_B02g061230 [Arachis hypogaea]|uniref:Uncharacterized protein n=1 Tax=Arachis hypogaea TaxID=3818 RepID=A0A445AKD8_ARAHY|nr:hypothetical protein Ahy_B02g061230 [Arachis hypogaea]